ncbi:MAG: hypothetical protein WBG38_09720 [Nodosilinea sp.]
MWHCFSVALAVVAVSGVWSAGGLTQPSQFVSTLSTLGSDRPELAETVIAEISGQRNRRGTGRRGMRG